MARVHRSRVIAVSADLVWEVVGDFGSLAKWFPFVEHSLLDKDGGPRQVGTRRRNHIDDGTVVEEQLVELSDRHRRMVYEIVVGVPAVKSLESEITVHEISDSSRALVAWTTRFDPVGDPAPIVQWVQTSMMDPCLAELERCLTTA